MSTIHINSDAQAHINAYLEYRNIVGDADGGKLLSEEEYAEFKRKAIEARKHRLYVSWRPKGSDLECRVIGPLSKCMCDHRYRDHETDTKNKKRVFCRVKTCDCRHFEHVPVRGCQDVKCHCKHSFREHDSRTRVCQRNPCRNACTGFKSSFGCACGLTFSDHHTVYETKEERVAKGLPVENLCGGGKGYAALGGLLNFSSLADGVERLGLTDGASNAPAIQHAENLQFMKPKTKLTEEDELALYASKYDSNNNFGGNSSGGNRVRGNSSGGNNSSGRNRVRGNSSGGNNRVRGSSRRNNNASVVAATTNVSRRPRRRTSKANMEELRESREPSEDAQKYRNDVSSVPTSQAPLRQQNSRRPSRPRQSLSGASRTKSHANEKREPAVLEPQEKFSVPFAVPKPRASLPQRRANPASQPTNPSEVRGSSKSSYQAASEYTRSAIRKDRLSLLKKKRPTGGRRQPPSIGAITSSPTSSG